MLRKRLFDSNQLYGMSRHFIWLIPVTNLCVFLALGRARVRCRAWHGRAAVAGFSARLLCAVTLLPMALVAFPQIYGLAWLVVALGARGAARSAARATCPAFSGGSSRSVFRVALGTVAILWASLWVPDRIKQSREPPAPCRRRVAQCPLDRDGHRRGRPLEPPWLRPRHQHDSGRAGRAGDPVRFRAGGRVMDAAVACDDVYRTMDARAVGRLAHSARRHASHAGRVSRGRGLRDGRLRGQHHVLCQRFGPGPRLYHIPGFHLPRAHRLQDDRPGQSSLAGDPVDR